MLQRTWLSHSSPERFRPGVDAVYAGSLFWGGRAASRRPHDEASAATPQSPRTKASGPTRWRSGLLLASAQRSVRVTRVSDPLARARDSDPLDSADPTASAALPPGAAGRAAQLHPQSRAQRPRDSREANCENPLNASGHHAAGRRAGAVHVGSAVQPRPPNSVGGSNTARSTPNQQVALRPINNVRTTQAAAARRHEAIAPTAAPLTRTPNERPRKTAPGIHP